MCGGYKTAACVSASPTTLHGYSAVRHVAWVWRTGTESGSFSPVRTSSSGMCSVEMRHRRDRHGKPKAPSQCWGESRQVQLWDVQGSSTHWGLYTAPQGDVDVTENSPNPIQSVVDPMHTQSIAQPTPCWWMKGDAPPPVEQLCAATVQHIVQHECQLGWQGC